MCDMKAKFLNAAVFLFVLGAISLTPATMLAQPTTAQPGTAAAGSNVYPIQEAYVDAHGEMIYYTIIGNGPPLLIVHGGPGASHEYFLPYLLPLARQNRL